MVDSLCTLSRYEKSLGLLAVRFLSLLKRTPNGVLDLKKAADLLAVRQKRRIYDITNVLEGVGLIRKKNKNVIKWMGSDGSLKDQLNKVKSLKKEVAKMKKYEGTLETHLQCCQQSLKNITEDEENMKKSYVKDSDMDRCFQDNVFLTIKAPPGTLLEVPIVNNNKEKPHPKYKIHLKSGNGPVEVFYLQQGCNLKDVRNLKPDGFDQGTLQSEFVENQSPSNTEIRPSNGNGQILTEEMIEASVVLGDLKDFPATTNIDIDLLAFAHESDVIQPFLRLSPPHNNLDFSFNLGENEGVLDLFDVPKVMK